MALLQCFYMRMQTFLTALTSVVLVLAMAVTVAQAKGKLVKTEEFTPPDIKEQFCGGNIDYRICKCAFHGQMCKDIGKSQSQADHLLYFKYNTHVAGLRATFKGGCSDRGGLFENDKCLYFEEEKEELSDKEKECLPKDFETNWKKYSDIDDAIPIGERSNEAKEFADALASMRTNAEARFIIARDMEIDRLARQELRAYKTALVQNIKANLLRSFWRLAWVTYDTAAGASLPGKDMVQGAASTGKTFAKLFEEVEDKGDLLIKLGNLLSVARSVTPGDSKLAINTDSTTGKFKSLGLTTGISVLENLGDPAGAAQVGVSVFGEIVGIPMPPKADITPEEIEILRTQHLSNKAVDDVLQESYRVNSERRRELAILDEEFAAQKARALEWEAKERDRVKNEIVDSCK